MKEMSLLKDLTLGIFDNLAPQERFLFSSSLRLQENNVGKIFSKRELEELKNLNDGYVERIKKLPQAIIKKNLKD